jgi:hypothetical protein
MTSPNTGDIVRLSHFNARFLQALQHRSIVSTLQRRMRLPGGTEICFDPQMNLHFATFKPASAAFGQCCRLVDFLHSEQAGIEVTSARLRAGGHSQLNVVNRNKRDV